MANVLIHNWDIPESCTKCSLFANVVAPKNRSIMFCRITKEKFNKDDAKLLVFRRSPNCPMEANYSGEIFIEMRYMPEQINLLEEIKKRRAENERNS